MAIAYVKEVAQGVGTTDPYSISVSANPAAGNLLVARIGFRASGATTFVGVSDSNGNTWVVHVQNNTANGHAVLATTAMDVLLLDTSDTITFDFSGTPANGACAIVDEFSGLDTSGTRADQTATGTATTTSRAAGTTPTTTVADELVVAAYAGNGNETAWAKGASFTDFTTPSLSRTTTAMVEGQYRIVSATGAYSAAATGVSLSTAGSIVTLKAGGANVTGAAALALAATPAADGQQSSFGASALALALASTAAGFQDVSGTAALALTETGAAAGYQDASGASALSLVASLTAAGRQDASGASALSLALGLAAAGYQDAQGAAALALAGALAAAGAREALAAVALALSAAPSASGRQNALASASLALSAACGVVFPPSFVLAGTQLVMVGPQLVFVPN